MRIVLKASPALVVLALSVFLLTQKGNAIPAFSREYATSCLTCHIVFPKLNDFGKAFKDAGFRFPKDEETYIKVAPVMLGAEAQKQNFPNSVWPGTIPGMPPIGLRFNSFFQATGANRNRFDVLTPPGSIPQTIPQRTLPADCSAFLLRGTSGAVSPSGSTTTSASQALTVRVASVTDI